MTDRVWHAVGGVGIFVGVVACAAWSFAPLPDAASVFRARDTGPGAATPSPATPTPLSAASFQVPIWQSGPAPAVAPEPTTQVSPQGRAPMELLALESASDEQRARAALYLVNLDTVVLARAGDTIASVTLEGIDADGVRIREGARTYRLDLTRSAR